MIFQRSPRTITLKENVVKMENEEKKVDQKPAEEKSLELVVSWSFQSLRL